MSKPLIKLTPDTWQVRGTVEHAVITRLLCLNSRTRECYRAVAAGCLVIVAKTLEEATNWSREQLEGL